MPKLEYGIGYMDFFNPFIKMPSICILLKIVAFHKWDIDQVNVFNTFLHGTIDTTLYMKKPPPSIIGKSFPQHVCLLHKVIYGLKQTSWWWLFTFFDTPKILGFVVNKDGPSLFIYNNNDTLIYILL